MRNCQVELNAISFNAAISACEKAGLWKVALQLVREMTQRKVRAHLKAAPEGQEDGLRGPEEGQSSS